jgi:hypothetical protein
MRDIYFEPNTGARLNLYILVALFLVEIFYLFVTYCCYGSELRAAHFVAGEKSVIFIS